MPCKQSLAVSWIAFAARHAMRPSSLSRLRHRDIRSSLGTAFLAQFAIPLKADHLRLLSNQSKPVFRALDLREFVGDGLFCEPPVERDSISRKIAEAEGMTSSKLDLKRAIRVLYK